MAGGALGELSATPGMSVDKSGLGGSIPRTLQVGAGFLWIVLGELMADLYLDR
jgi:hypothetical protein